MTLTRGELATIKEALHTLLEEAWARDANATMDEEPDDLADTPYMRYVDGLIERVKRIGPVGIVAVKCAQTQVAWR